jgi:putative SOS response-associated peptidase YedK
MATGYSPRKKPHEEPDHFVTQLYRLDCTAADIAARFGTFLGEDPWAGGYVAPGKFAPVVTAGREFIAGPRPAGRSLQPRITPRLWGVAPPPNADDPMRRITNVRTPDSPFWIGNLRNSEFRCLVPATAFMLWGSGTDYEGRRLRHWFAFEGAMPFALAGVWKDDDVPSFAIMTRTANGLPRKLGCAAMPVIVPSTDADWQCWLHGGWQMAQSLTLAPAPELQEIIPSGAAD